MIAPLTLPHLRAIAEAHVSLDPTAFLSRVKGVGVTFREKIFYSVLLRDPESFVWIYLWNNLLVGYISGTKNTSSLYRRLKGFRPLLLSFLLIKTLFKAPRTFIEYAASMSRVERTISHQAIQAEILSFGVLPEYRTDEFERSHGIHVADALFRSALKSFQDWGVDQFKVMTIQENKAASRFYEKRGCHLVGTEQPFNLPCNVFVGSPHET